MNNSIDIYPENNVVDGLFFSFKWILNSSRDKIKKNWVHIEENNYRFIQNIIVQNKINDSIDNLAWIYNYFLFLHRVKLGNKVFYRRDIGSYYGNDKKEMDIETSELIHLIKEVSERNPIKKVTIEYDKDNKISISTKFHLFLFELMLKKAYIENEKWFMNKREIEKVINSGKIKSYTAKKRGGPSNVSKDAIKISTKIFNEYLSNIESQNDKKNFSSYTIIGQIFDRIGIIMRPHEVYYRSDKEFWRISARDLGRFPINEKNPFHDEISIESIIYDYDHLI